MRHRGHFDMLHENIFTMVTEQKATKNADAIHNQSHGGVYIRIWYGSYQMDHKSELQYKNLLLWWIAYIIFWVFNV